MKPFYAGFRRFCALLIGLVFFVAGMLKLMDPVGATLVIQEYLKFFHVDFLSALAKPIAVAMALVEAELGLALISGVWRKTVALITMAMTAFFTVVTLILVIFNPEMDCGCFGEAIHLTHFQTFMKNVALCLLCVGAFIPLGRDSAPRKSKYIGFGLATLAVLAFTGYSLKNLPLVDFATYPPQTQIFAAYDGSDVPGPVLSFKDEYGDYCDDMASLGPVMIISAYEPEKITEEKWESITDYVFEIYAAAMNPLVLITSADLENVPLELRQCTYMTDYRTAIGLNRSNGGVSYLVDGTVVAKWPEGKQPKGDDLTALQLESPDEFSLERNSHQRFIAQAAGIFCLAVALLF